MEINLELFCFIFGLRPKGDFLVDGAGSRLHLTDMEGFSSLYSHKRQEPPGSILLVEVEGSAYEAYFQDATEVLKILGDRSLNPPEKVFRKTGHRGSQFLTAKIPGPDSRPDIGGISGGRFDLESDLCRLSLDRQRPLFRAERDRPDRPVSVVSIEAWKYNKDAARRETFGDHPILD